MECQNKCQKSPRESSPPAFQSLEPNRHVYLNCFLASFFKCNSLPRKSVRFGYLNAQIPAPKNRRSPSSCRRVFQRPPAHPFPPRVKALEVLWSLPHPSSPVLSSPSGPLLVDLEDPPDRSPRAQVTWPVGPFPAARVNCPRSLRWPPSGPYHELPPTGTERPPSP